MAVPGARSWDQSNDATDEGGGGADADDDDDDDDDDRSEKEAHAAKHFILNAIRQHPFTWVHDQVGVWNSRDFALEAVKKDARSGLMASTEECRADKVVVLEAVKRDGEALAYASKALQADREVVLEAVRQSPKALRCASCRLSGNKAFVLEAVKLRGMSLLYASDKLRADYDVVLEATKNDGHALDCAPPKLREDRELQLLAERCSEGRCNNPFRLKMPIPVIRSAIAVRGERAPILTVALSIVSSSSSSTSTPAPSPQMDTASSYVRCHVSFMSGASFLCDLPDDSSLAQGPIVEELAMKLVEEVPRHVKLDYPVERVFISFLVGPDGETEVVSAWDWDMSLFFYLPE